MPTTPFGNAGTRTVRTYIPAVTVQFDEGDFLRFKLTVSGAEAIFAFECEDEIERLSQSSFENHPTSFYTWDLGIGLDQEPDRKEDVYGVGMLFTAVAPGRYTLEVEHRRKGGGLIGQLIDVDYESTAPEDKYNEILTVFAI